MLPSVRVTADRRQSLGILGEDLACEALIDRGYVVLARRYRTRLGEIDIVARDGLTVVFVEVKARQSGVFGDGAEAVGLRKQQRIGTMAAYYLARHGLQQAPARFDVVSVLLPEAGSARVEVFRNAFDLSPTSRRGW